MAVVVKDMMVYNGPLADYSIEARFEHLLVTILICGALQMFLGITGLTKLERLISSAAMIGFLNGLAIIIFKS